MRATFRILVADDNGVCVFVFVSLYVGVSVCEFLY